MGLIQQKGQSVTHCCHCCFFISFHVGCVFIHTDVPVNSQGHNWNVLEYSGYTNAGKFISVVFTFDELYCTIIRSQYGYKCQSDYR